MIRFLQQCDLVKFARFAPPPSEAAAAVDQAREMVHVTTPAAVLERLKGQGEKDMPSKTGPNDHTPKDMPVKPPTSEPPRTDVPAEPAPKREEGPR